MSFSKPGYALSFTLEANEGKWSEEEEEAFQRLVNSLLATGNMVRVIYDAEELGRSMLISMPKIINRIFEQMREIVMPHSHAELFRARYPVKEEPISTTPSEEQNNLEMEIKSESSM